MLTNKMRIAITDVQPSTNISPKKVSRTRAYTRYNMIHINTMASSTNGSFNAKSKKENNPSDARFLDC